MKLVCGGGNSKPKPLQVQIEKKESVFKDDEIVINQETIQKIERETGTKIATQTELLELIEGMIEKQNELKEDIQTQTKMILKQRDDFEAQISDINDQKDEKYSEMKRFIENYRIIL